MKKLELQKIKITKLEKFAPLMIRGGGLVNEGERTDTNSERPPCLISEAGDGNCKISDQLC